MSFANPYLVTDIVHPRTPAFDPQFDPAMHPDGYVDFVGQLGYGAYCRGLSVHTPESRSSFWTQSMIEELLVMGLEQGNWDSGVLSSSDLRNCMVVADSDEGDSFVTCPRYGKQVFELPRHQFAIREIGTSIQDVLDDYAHRCRVAFSYFDPFPSCSRRGAIRFVSHPDVGFDVLLQDLASKWGIHPPGTASTYDLEFYQDRFVPALRAHVGFYFNDERPPQYRLPAGSITVTMTLDVDAVPQAIAFANDHMIPDDAHLDPNFGRGCVEHAAKGK